MATQAVVPAGEKALSEYQEWQKALHEAKPDEGWADDGTGDFQPTWPLLKLVQGTSGMEGSSSHLGEFFRTDTETYIKEAGIVPLFLKSGMVFFEEGKSAPSCRADRLNGAYVPAPNQPLWLSDTYRPRGAKESIPTPLPTQPKRCDLCPFSAWIGDTKSACNETYAVLADMDGELIQMRFMGSSLGPLRRFIQKQLKPKNLSLFTHRLRMWGREEKRDGKKWMQLELAADRLTVDEVKRYDALARLGRSRFEAEVEIVHDAPDEPKDVTPAADEWGDGSQSYVAPRGPVTADDDLPFE